MLPMDKISGSHHLLKVSGLHLPARHDLLDGRELQNRSQNGGHGAVIPLRPIIEDEVLKLSALNGHEHGAVGGGDWGDHSPLAGIELDSPFGARPDADAATQAQGLVEARLPAPGLMRVACGHQSHGLYWTDRRALAAAVARFGAHFRQKAGGGDGVQDGEALGREHCLTAASAAVADERHLLLYILAELHEVVLQGLVQQIHAFLGIDLARNAVLDQRLGRAAEGHADVHGGIAGLPQMLHFVPAVAGAYAHVRGRLNHFAGSFVVHHSQRLIRGKRSLVHKCAAQLRLAPGEEIAHKILFHIQVLEEELGQQLLIVSVAQAHH